MNTLTVLYVDDEDDIREVALMALELDGAIRATGSVSAAEALAAMIAGPLPDVVLLDVMMPGMSGTELARVMATDPLLKAVPIVFLTARPRGLEALFPAVLGTLAKPFDPMTLALELRSLMAGHRS